IRYTSFGLAVCEAMMAGMPIVGLATTEMASVIENGRNGFIDTNVDTLKARMTELLRDIDTARALGEAAHKTALQRFALSRFLADWDQTLRDVVSKPVGKSKTVHPLKRD